MATARMAGGALLSTVSDVAGSVSEVATTLTRSVRMANNYVTEQLEKQELRMKIDKVDMTNRLLEDAARRTAERREENDIWVSQSQNRAKHYQDALDELKQAIAA